MDFLRSKKPKKSNSKDAKKKIQKKKSVEKKEKAINIFDQDTFTFKIESCIHPDQSLHTPVQTQAFESFAASILSSGVEGLIKEYTEVLLPFVPVG